MSEKPNRPLGPVLLIALLLEFLLAGFLVLAPFGFDHPSSAGLDFDHLVCFGFWYLVIFLVGVVSAAKAERWGVLALQLVPLALVGCSVMHK